MNKAIVQQASILSRLQRSEAIRAWNREVDERKALKRQRQADYRALPEATPAQIDAAIQRELATT